MSNLEMRRGDLKPDLIIDLTDEGLVMPTTTASSISVVGAQNGAFLFKRPAVSDADGMVRMEWTAPDTDTPGTIVVEVELVWPGAKPQTIRPDGVVKIYPDLG